MNKNSTPKNPKLNWPKTRERRAAELQHRTAALGAVATVGQMMTAASAVPMPRSQKLLADAAEAASKGMVGQHSKGKKGKKRSWQRHADEYFAKNNAWNEVNGIYLASINLLKTSLALTPLLREQELTKLVKNKRLLARNVMAITRDTQALADEVMALIYPAAPVKVVAPAAQPEEKPTEEEKAPEEEAPAAEPVELIVFAAASMTDW